MPRNTWPRNEIENASDRRSTDGPTYQVAKLRRLEKQMARAERQLLNAWERTEQLWSVMREG